MDAEIVERIRAGVPARDVAQELGITRRRVYDVAARHRLRLNDQRGWNAATRRPISATEMLKTMDAGQRLRCLVAVCRRLRRLGKTLIEVVRRKAS